MDADRPERITERDWGWWLDYVRGKTQLVIAREAGVTQQTVSAALKRVRDQIPEEDRSEMVQRSLEMLHDLQQGALEIWRAAPAPVFVGKDGMVAIDPDSQQPVRDHSGRLKAAEYALRVNESVRKLLGLDAAKGLDVTVTGAETDAARRLAEEAARRVAGED
jgi:hypothetical protein